MKKQKQDIVIYKNEDNKIYLRVKFENDTVWLTQSQMADLFDRDIRTISEHIKNVFEEGELEKDLTIRNFRIVQKEGGRKVRREIDHYNLNAIISVGYRVKSLRGTQFRIWATNVLRNHLVKGYTINEKRLKDQSEKFLDFQKTVKALTSIIKKKELTSEEATGILQIISDYNYAFDILDQYDKEELKIKDVTKEEIYKLDYDNAKKLIEKLQNKIASSDLFGREKDETFKSSLSTIYQTYESKELYPSIEEKAANLLYLIVKNHSFVDGNKRIAAFLFVWFLDKNGILYDENRSKRIADNALVALTLLIAESNPREKDTIVKVIVNLINKESFEKT